MNAEAEIAAAIASKRARYTEKAIRVQFGETLHALARERADFVVLTADLMYATGIDRFGADFPARLLNVGIAEQNMTGIAAGLALCGKLPIVSGYAAFTTLRAVEQAKVDAAYNGVKIILAAQSAGLSYGVGGPTHQTFEDVAIMRSIPNTVVVVPADAHEVDACLRAALEHDAAAPIYIRLGRGPEYLVSTPGEPFTIGTPKLLREGRDICLIANGAMVAEALIAADQLLEFDIEASVLNVHTVKPLGATAIRDAVRPVKAAIVIEEHSTAGGLGSAVLECLSEVPHPPVRLIGLDGTFPPIGPPRQLRAALGLDAANIVTNALDLLPLRVRRQAAV